MIVKKEERDGKIMCTYDSSTICGSIFDKLTSDLIVIFKNGGQYKYPNVSLTDYVRFETADSNGSVFNVHIKKKYLVFETLQKLSPDTMETLLNEIIKLKDDENKLIISDKLNPIIDLMKLVVLEFNENNVIDNNVLRLIETKLVDYNTFIRTL
jgi:hypothetical protein